MCIPGLARSQVWIHVQALPAAFAEPRRVLRGWHPVGTLQLGWQHLCTPLSPHRRGTGCLELLPLGRGSSAPAAGVVSELPCSRLGGLDSSSPVRSIFSPGSSRHRRCWVPADVSQSRWWPWSGAVGLVPWGRAAFPSPPVLQHPPHRLPRVQCGWTRSLCGPWLCLSFPV